MRQLLREGRVLDLVELERENQRLDADRVQPLRHRLLEFGERRVGHVPGISELRIGADSPGKILHPLIGEQGFEERGATEACKLPLVIPLELSGQGGQRLQIALDFRRIGPRIEVG